MTNYQKTLKLIKGVKRIMVQTQRYELADVYRWLESILEKDGENLSDDSLQYFHNIVASSRNQIAKQEKKPTV